MPTFQELCRSSASKGGMEKTVVFHYDEHVVGAVYTLNPAGP